MKRKIYLTTEDYSNLTRISDLGYYGRRDLVENRDFLRKISRIDSRSFSYCKLPKKANVVIDLFEDIISKVLEIDSPLRVEVPQNLAGIIYSEFLSEEEISSITYWKAPISISQYDGGEKYYQNELRGEVQLSDIFDDDDGEYEFINILIKDIDENSEYTLEEFLKKSKILEKPMKGFLPIVMNNTVSVKGLGQYLKENNLDDENSFVKLVLYPSSLFLKDETDTFNNYFLMGYLGENLIEPNETIKQKYLESVRNLDLETEVLPKFLNLYLKVKDILEAPNPDNILLDILVGEMYDYGYYY